jgi:hypothetical protein
LRSDGAVDVLQNLWLADSVPARGGVIILKKA